MKQVISTLVFLVISFSSSAQFVGDGASKPSPTKSTDLKKPVFSIKFGAAMPLSPFNTTPKRSSMPQYSQGIMGATSGFFVEAGMELSLSNPDKMIGFYYFPILASYWKTSLDWSELGGFFANKETYLKPIAIMDIAQRYGIVVKPVDDLFLALYYRPGLIIPFKYEIKHEAPPAGESFLFTGEMSVSENAPVLMMSHTVGISVRYKIASISIEEYFAKPTYDITYKDIDISPVLNVNQNTVGKIPVKMLVISLALSF